MLFYDSCNFLCSPLLSNNVLIEVDNENNKSEIFYQNKINLNYILYKHVSNYSGFFTNR